MGKRTALFTMCLLLACCFVLPASADQQEDARLNQVSANLLWTAAWIIGNPNVPIIPISIEYQRVLAEHWVLSIIPTLNINFPVDGSTPFTFIQFAEMDWHPFDPGLNGFLAGAFVAAGVSGPQFLNNVNIQSFSFGAGPALGYQFLFPFGLIIDISIRGGLGAGYSTLNGWLLQTPIMANINIGYAF